MKSYEALQLAISGRTPEHAKAMHLSTSIINKWQEPHIDYTDSGAFNPLDRSETIIETALELGIPPKDALAPLYWLAEQFNCIVTPVPPVTGDLNTLHIELLRTIKDFGHLAEAVGDALGDGKITRKESDRISREGWELIRQVGIFLSKVKESVR